VDVRYLRWKRAPYALPAVAVLAIAAGAASPNLSGASSSPVLSPETAQQLVADIASAQAPQLSGTITWTANLGLSDLSTVQSDLGGNSGGSSGFNPSSLLAGTYQISVWAGGATAEHLALSTQPGQEVDLVRNGNEAWFWDSSTQKVTHLTWTPPSPGSTSSPTPALTPQQVAAKLLNGAAPTTTVVPGGTAYVAGQPAYQLMVTPKSASGTTVDHIEVDVGATGTLKGVPLQVAVYAVGQQSPALQLGYTGAIQLGPPPASELTFTPPPGSTVVDRQLSPGSTPYTGWTGYAPPTQPTTAPMPSATVPAGHTRTIGTGWTAVVTGNTGSSVLGANAQAALDAATTVVQVGSQQGRLFTSSLLNVLMMPNGQYYAGLVTPSVLESAASSGA
jgi:outer membrane lipoprotein-sorting protein